MGKKLKAQEIAYEYIKEMIDSNSWETGVKLIEQDISETLGISRTPIREAIQRLVDEEYLQKEVNKGVTINKKIISKKEFVERSQLVEILLSNYIFQLQIKGQNLDVNTCQKILEEITFTNQVKKRAQQMTHFLELFFIEMDNHLIKSLIIKQFDQMSYAKFPHDSHHFYYDEFVRSFKKVLEHVNTQKYDFARKEIRIFVNRLNLELIDQQV